MGASHTGHKFIEAGSGSGIAILCYKCKNYFVDDEDYNGKMLEFDNCLIFNELNPSYYVNCPYFVKAETHEK